MDQIFGVGRYQNKLNLTKIGVFKMALPQAETSKIQTS